MTAIQQQVIDQYLLSKSLPTKSPDSREPELLNNFPKQLYIDGQWCDGADKQTIAVYDPGLGSVFCEVACAQPDDVARAVEAAKLAFISWRETSGAQRAIILNRAADILEEEVQQFSLVESLDSGKPLGEAASDVASSVATFRYYAGCCDKIQGDSYPLGSSNMSFSNQVPVGVTAHVIPWNFPLNTAVRGVAPALAAGCTAVVKPAQQTPLTALMLADVLTRAGLPQGVYNAIPGLAEAGAALVSHPDVNHVTFTGSVDTGVKVMCSAAQNITSVTLELGGKSAIVALDDCDIEKTAEGVLWAIFYNAGQVCSAGSRLVVERSIHQKLVAAIVEKTQQLVAKHPLQAPNYGAINSAEQLAKIDGFIQRARDRGCNVRCGGHVLDREGWFYAPTIVDELSNDDELVQQEIFGPVLSVQVVDNQAQAIEAANCTNFALAAGVYSQNIDRALQVAQALEAGQVTVNDYWAGGISVPFGGDKHSGIGREKGLLALTNYCTTKAITLAF
ncbi:MAG: aldehyde dehydrogenase family protein [Oceanospirillaceae bacterium]